MMLDQHGVVRTCESVVKRMAATLELVDVVGAGSRPGFNYLHGFLCPRSFCIVCSTRKEFRRLQRNGFDSRLLYTHRASLMRNLFCAVFRNDVEEAWVRLSDPERQPTQKERDEALRWTAMFSRRHSMYQLLVHFGADTAKADKMTKVDDLAHIADAVFKFEYQQSLRYMPCPADVVRALPANRRADVIMWLSQACESVRLEDTVVACVVLTLDRYFAADSSRHLDEKKLLQLTLAALSTEMKLSKSSACQQSHRERILNHLSQGVVSLRSIWQEEADVLVKLDFLAALPTPMSFLQTLVHHFRSGFELMFGQKLHNGGYKAWATVALFLTHLAVYDVELEYRYPHAVLAYASLGVALLCLGSEAVIEADANQQDEFADITNELHEGLVADCASRCPDTAPGCKDMLRDCEDSLLNFWAECAHGSSPWSGCYAYLRQTFGNITTPCRPKSATDMSDQETCILILSDGFLRFQALHGVPASASEAH
mmetsp:Transcript_106962/g.300829  ORF Transcript_106962/g.300829 Transcript_106962/m.300829 type:complete len:485 (+) Transcript_106962:3-1457(+)